MIIACGLLHYPRKLPVLDQLNSKKVYYKIPKIGDYEENQVTVVGGGESAMDAAFMVLQRNGRVDMLIREEVPLGKADTLVRIRRLGGNIHPSREIAAACRGEKIVLTRSEGNHVECDLAIVQIGFLSAKETFQRLDLRLNHNGGIAIDLFYETSRRGIFAVGDVHGDIKLITVAWAEGIQVAIYAFKEITSPKWLNKITIARPKDHDDRGKDHPGGTKPNSCQAKR